MAWEIVVVEPALSWLHGLRRTDRDTLIQVSQAVILVGGDKAGNWSGWYRVAVPQAEQAYAEHLKRIDGEDGAQ
jgi:hypothetical protein